MEGQVGNYSIKSTQFEKNFGKKWVLIEMAKRSVVNVGDIFELKLSGMRKAYFQFIMRDSVELNSEVIRAFDERYESFASPDLKSIINGKIAFFAHVYIKDGIKSGTWEKIGNVAIENELEPPSFRSSDDYGDPDIKISTNWHVWRANDPEPRHVGKLPPECQKYDVGGVRPPSEIKEILDTGKSSWFYPGY